MDILHEEAQLEEIDCGSFFNGECDLSSFAIMQDISVGAHASNLLAGCVQSSGGDSSSQGIEGWHCDVEDLEVPARADCLAGRCFQAWAMRASAAFVFPTLGR